MKTQVLLTVALCLLFLVGCDTGSVKVSPVIEGTIAPHAGYNIGPDLWVEPGDDVKVTGAVIWLEGTDPNNLF